MLVTASLSAAGIFYSLQQTAVSQSRLTQSEELASEATGLFPVNDPQAMLLSVQAYESAPTEQAGNALAAAAEQPLDSVLTENSTADFTSVAFSHDGAVAAADSQNGTISLWDAATRSKIAVLTTGFFIRSVAFSPGGQVLATGGDTGTDGTGTGGVSLWDTATGKRTAVLISNDNVFSVTFSADGKLLAVGSVNGFAVLNIATRQWAFSAATGSDVVSVAFSPDDKTLAVGTGSGSVALWSTATRRQVNSLPVGA